MDTAKHTTATVPETPITCVVSAAVINAITNSVDKTGGLMAKAEAAKHLSSLVGEEFDRLLGHGKGKAGQFPGSREFTLYESTIKQMEWLLSEVSSVSRDLSKMVDQLNDDLTPLSDAAFYAKQGAKP